ncbi:50S ribosomal protein L25/general stress protein Ctc [Hallella colorans]|uniref:Large ribosomal subunit protein bL25 n=1 Tax=Hallella colorans TaxID=1703337 RepID=A0A2U0U7K6_9BACT|nr:50S ribosomal protein L25/general stress protein Ctc [Hallella colorans]PVX53589.1 large subunit ribosomal protein L25 [Hallella colorans]
MKEISITGQKREALGKKASKAIRKQGMIPCNLYGENKQDGKPVALAFASPFSELRKIIYTPHIYVIKIDIDGTSHTAVMKEIQFHPVTDAPLHVDFYEVNDQQPITIGIPVKLTGLAQGVRDGGRMNLSIRKIAVTAPYQQIPEHLDIDVTALKIGKSIKVGDLSFEGLEFATSKDVVVCSIKMTRNAAQTEEEAPEEETTETPAEGE